MMRILFIARYRDDTMRRKVQYIASRADVKLQAIEPAYWQDELLKVRALGSPGYARQTLGMWGKASDPHRAFYRTLNFDLPRFNPHIIHAEEEPDSLAAAQISLARAVFAPHAKLILHTWQNIPRRRNLLVEGIAALSLKAADAVMCANQDAQNILRQRGYLRPAPLIPAVGVDTTLFTPQPQLPRANFVLGYFGRFTLDKGLEALLKALHDLPAHFTLRLIGNGPDESVLRTLVAQLNLSERVVFLPPRQPSELVTEYAQLDAFVLPSRTTPVWKEQLGRVLLEAMACRVPVIGSNSGAIPEVIGEAGLIFPQGDISALIACILKLAEAPEFCVALAERGYQRVQALYSQRHLAERTITLYRQLLTL